MILEREKKLSFVTKIECNTMDQEKLFAFWDYAYTPDSKTRADNLSHGVRSQLYHFLLIDIEFFL